MGARIVIVGGGFAGLNAAKVLARDSQLQIQIIDRTNYHLFQPLLYQVATAGLSPGDIAVPIRAQFSEYKNVEVHMREVVGVDLNQRRLQLKGLTEGLEYDYLILACGAQQSYFSHPEWEKLAPPLKSLAQATEIRRRILTAFEMAENETDENKQNELMNFVVVGGGPTGVELAGAIADISRTVLRRDFRRVNAASAAVILVEAGPRILSSFSPRLSALAQKALVNMGVHVKTDTRVEGITKDGVRLQSRNQDEWLAARNVIWAAGVQAAVLNFAPPVAQDRQGRVIAQSDLSLEEHPEVFVVGDMAAVQGNDGQFLPGLAPVAIQAGRAAALNILRSIENRPRKPFVYRDKGQMATIGANKAIAEIGRLRVSGRPAWILWLFVHILYLVGFKNRISVFLQWCWSYIFRKRGARLIIEHGAPNGSG